MCRIYGEIIAHLFVNICNELRPNCLPRSFIGHAPFFEQAFHTGAKKFIAWLRTHSPGSNQSRTNVFMFSSGNGGRFQQPIFQWPQTQSIRIQRNATFIEQNFIAHDICHPIEFTLIHSVHVFFVHPRVFCERRISPDDNFILWIQLGPRLGAIVRPFAFIPNPHKMQFFWYHNMS